MKATRIVAIALLGAACTRPVETQADSSNRRLEPSGSTSMGDQQDASRRSDASLGPVRFTDVTAHSHVALVGGEVPSTLDGSPFFPFGQYLGNGASAGDVDGDGLADLAIAGGFGEPTMLYHNLGSLTFEAVPGDASGAPFARAVGVALADLDNDGDPDLVLASGDGCTLYENVSGRMVLRDKSPGYGAVGVLPADLDGDGLLDLFFYAHANMDTQDAPTQLMLRNRGSFAFDDVTDMWGLSSYGISWAAASFDWDGDGVPDLFVANDTFTPGIDAGISADPSLPHDLLFRNGLVNGSRTFANVAAVAGLDEGRSSMNVVVDDFDGDGRFDLFISNWGRNPLLLGKPDGSYVDAADRFGLTEVWMVGPDCPAERRAIECLLTTWGAARFDADHDGFDDLVMVRGNVSFLPDARQPSAAWHGGPDGTLTKVDAGLGRMAARALLPVDLDGDGDLDLVVTQHGGPVRLFRNEAPASRGWLQVRLEGVHSNREGVGAVVTATLRSGRQIRRLVGAGGVVQSWAPAEAHFVTGGEPIVEVEVRWPFGGVQKIDAPSLNRVLMIREL